ncbi:hypothetical protein DV735_g1986, partial [Chaetothyriales sp. CBS 134920]
MGKVHGSLARAGKVKSQTPKVEPQEKKKTPKGRAKKRITYTRRFVNVTLTGGKRKRLPFQRVVALGRRPQSSGFPHKEYFQTPGQSPLPDTSPYNPNEPIQSFPVAERSWLARGFRSLFWAVLFGVIGVGTGAGLVTWEYLQPQFEPGSPEDAEVFEEIIDTLNEHPVAEDLRGDGWIEDEFYTPRFRRAGPGNHLIQDHLMGPRGVVIKSFRHPVMQYTILLAFTGFAVEGWPDTVHGGVIASVMIEAAQRHLNNFYRSRAIPDITLDQNQEAWTFNIDYKKPMRPGEVYTIVVPPGAFTVPPDGSLDQVAFRFAALAMDLDTAPRVGSQYDPISQTSTHTLEIPSARGVDVPHAIATVEVHVKPDADKAQSAEDSYSNSPLDSESG